MKRGFLIDMDGVIYQGNKLIPGADTFIKTLQDRKIPFLFMTNNSQRTPQDAINKLAPMGIEVDESNIYTSAMATAYFLQFMKPSGSAFVLGEGGLITSLTQAGYSIVNSKPDFVVVGEGRNFTLEMVNVAVEMILSGSKLIATNLDPSPKKQGWDNLGIKAIVTMLEEATGKTAFSVGKPSPVMMRAARKTLGLEASETIIIGDTMSTDILGGVQLGYATILTLSGVTTKENINDYPFKADLVINSIKDLDVEKALSL
jgi:NagD protein